MPRRSGCERAVFRDTDICNASRRGDWMSYDCLGHSVSVHMSEPQARPGVHRRIYISQVICPWLEMCSFHPAIRQFVVVFTRLGVLITPPSISKNPIRPG